MVMEKLYTEDRILKGPTEDHLTPHIVMNGQLIYHQFIKVVPSTQIYVKSVLNHIPWRKFSN